MSLSRSGVLLTLGCTHSGCNGFAQPPVSGMERARAESWRTVRVSVSSQGVEGVLSSTRPAMSSSGRFVAFESLAPNLVLGDTNAAGGAIGEVPTAGGKDVFLHDRDADGDWVFDEIGAIHTRRVSVSSSGRECHPRANGSGEASMSWDGRIIAFSSDCPDLIDGRFVSNQQIYVHDVLTRRTTLVSVDENGQPGDMPSGNPHLAFSGRFVAFQSWATNLTEDATSWGYDVYLRDLDLGRTELVSVDDDGVPFEHGGREPSVSGDGRFVAFSSFDSYLGRSGVFLRDRQARTTRNIAALTPECLSAWGPKLSGNASAVAFFCLVYEYGSGPPPSGSNESEVYVFDLETGRAEVATIESTRTLGARTFSRYFFPEAISATGTYLLLRGPSEDGRVVPSPSTDLWLFDRDLKTSRLVSGGLVPQIGLMSNVGGAVSNDGRHVAFSSTSPLLVPGATSPGKSDVFVTSLSEGWIP